MQKNENKPGYKKTKVGWIPIEWSDSRLGENCAMKSGETITSKSISDDGKYRCYGGNGLRGYTVTFTHDGSFVLIGRQGALCGNVRLVTGKFYASEHAIVATNFSNSSPAWLAEALRFKDLNKFSESSAQPGLSVSKVLRMRIPTPPRHEQEGIAEVLSCWDKAIRKLELKIEKKRNIKKGLMQVLLSGKRRLPGFGTTENTEEHEKGKQRIPSEWEEIKLGELAQIKKGQQLNRLDQSKTGLYPVLNGGVQPLGYTNGWNTEKNTITISEGGNSCGFVNFNKTRFWCGGHCYSLNNKSTLVDKQYLYQFLRLFAILYG